MYESYCQISFIFGVYFVWFPLDEGVNSWGQVLVCCMQLSLSDMQHVYYITFTRKCFVLAVAAVSAELRAIFDNKISKILQFVCHFVNSAHNSHFCASWPILHVQNRRILTSLHIITDVQLPAMQAVVRARDRKRQHFGCMIRTSSLCTETLEWTVDRRRKQGKPRQRWTDRLVKQNSGGVFTVGERQAAMKNVAASSDLRSSAVRMEPSS